MNGTDSELIVRYTRDRAEDAFAEIVRRHLNLVHSAALRQVRSPQLAEEVAQSVFVKLARHAGQLAPATVLAAWLYQVTRREAVDVVRREARRQLREQISTQMNAMDATAADWNHIEPLLDDAMEALDEIDRTAVLLRYFENRSLREVGESLGSSEDAARKRVSRAVERLREYFTKRGVSVGASGLVLAISANSVQAAPAGLAVAVSAAASATVAGSVATATTVAATKTIAMTTLQKALAAAVVAAAIATGIYRARTNDPAIPTPPAAQSQPAAATPNTAAALATLQARVEDLSTRNSELLAALTKARAESRSLQNELDQSRRAAALYRELADQAKASADTHSTNAYPTARHALVGFGKLAQRSALFHAQAEDADLTPEEKAAREEVALNLAMETLQLKKVANQVGLGESSTLTKDLDAADGGACFLYGALGLDEQQFGGIYQVMQRFRDPVLPEAQTADKLTPEQASVIKQRNEQIRQDIERLLNPEQAKVFKLFGDRLRLIYPDDGRGVFGFTMED